MPVIRTSIWAQSLFSGLESAEARLVETDDPEHARSLVGELLSKHELKILDRHTPLRTVLDHYPIGPLSLNRLHWNTAVEVDPGHLEDYYLLCIPTAGQSLYRYGRNRFDLAPGQMAIISAGERFSFATSTDYDQYLLYIHKAQVDRAWQLLCGDAPPSPIVFSSHIEDSGPTWRALSPSLQTIAGLIRGTLASDRMPYAGDRLQEMLILSLLFNQPHTHSGAQHRTPGSRASKQYETARSYLLENLEEPLTLSQISIDLGITIRTLQWIFNKEVGMGPMQWLREQRLFAVRRLLLAKHDARRPPKITNIAMQYQFNHLGDFSRAYKRTFGESPSETQSKANT